MAYVFETQQNPELVRHSSQSVCDYWFITNKNLQTNLKILTFNQLDQQFPNLFFRGPFCGSNLAAVPCSE